MRVRGPWRSRGGAGASCRPSCGGRVLKGVGVPDGGHSAGQGTCGEQGALPGG